MKTIYIATDSNDLDNTHCFPVDKISVIECNAASSAIFRSYSSGIQTDSDDFTVKILDDSFKDFCKEFVREVNFGKQPRIVVIEESTNTSFFKNVDTSSNSHALSSASTDLNVSQDANFTGNVTIDTLIKKTEIVDDDNQNATITASQVADGVLFVHTSNTGAGTFTLPDNDDLDGTVGMVFSAKDALKFYYYNDGTQTVTVTPGAGGTVKGGATVSAGGKAIILVAPTSTSTHDIYLF